MGMDNIPSSNRKGYACMENYCPTWLDCTAWKTGDTAWKP